MRFCLTILGFALLASVASARDIYVDNIRGDDHHVGTMPELGVNADGPVRSIAKALRVARKGDRIVLNNTGVAYRESVTFQAGRHSGFPGSPFVLEGNGATLDGAALVPVDAWEVVGDDLYRFSPWRKAFNILFMDDKPLVKAPISTKQDLDAMQPLEWALFDDHIYFKSEKNLGLGGYRLTYTGLTVGITLYDVRFLEIRNLTVQGFQLDGINAHDNAFEVRLRGITARGNGRSGVSIGGASRVDVTGALLGNNGVAQLRSEGYCQVSIKQSDLLDNTGPSIQREGGKVEVDGEPFEPQPAEVQQAAAEVAIDNADSEVYVPVNYLEKVLSRLDVTTR